MSRYETVPGYNDRRWRKVRAAHLLDNPLCVMCQQAGRTVPATVVDHIKPHRGDPELFWDLDNLQSICKAHHDGAKQSQDRTGRVRGCDIHGIPLDPNSHWRK